jgi:hypothetical protein
LGGRSTSFRAGALAEEAMRQRDESNEYVKRAKEISKIVQQESAQALGHYCFIIESLIESLPEEDDLISSTL